MSQIINCCCGCPPLTADEWINVTKVVDYSTTPDPAGIAPYERPWYYIGGSSGDAACVPAGNSPSTCGGSGQPVCYNYGFDGVSLQFNRDISGVKDCTGSGLVTVMTNNCYQKTGNTVSFPRTGPRCGMGFKNVQAWADWSGLFGFFECCPDNTSQRKFTAIRKRIKIYQKTKSYFTVGGENSSTQDIEFDQTAGVDEYGNITRSGFARWREIAVSADVTIVDDTYCTVPGDSVGYDDFLLLDSVRLNCDGTLTGTYPDQPEYTDDPEPFVDWLWGYLKSGVGGTGAATIKTITAGNDRIEIVVEGENYDDLGGGDYSEQESRCSLIIELSGERLFSQVIADAKAMLTEWDLTDDKQYPWRTDAKTWLAPLVKRDSAAVAPTIDWTTDESCSFTNSQIYSGEIRGIPNPAGYGRHFDFWHLNLERATSNGNAACIACETGLGAYSTAPLPATATQWTNYALGSSSPGIGGFVMQIVDFNYYNGAAGPTPIDGVFMQKWVETLLEWPKLNAARSCGHDRWLRDETDDACVDSFDGTNLVLNALSTTEYTVGDLIGLAEGVFQVMTKTDAFNYTVGDGTTAGVVKYALPASITYTDCAKLRFPTARGICGELTVTSATQAAANDPISITTAKKHWLRAGDTVNFTGITGLSTGHAVTVVDETHFTVPFTGTFTPYSSGGKVSQTGADVAGDTTCTSRTYYTRKWLSSYREADADPEAPSYSLTETERTFTYSGKKPYVVCISPNGETFESGITFDFEDIEADLCFGKEWHMDVVQAVVDPNWQQPHEDCDNAGAWDMDSQPCANDGQYRYYPLVEPYEPTDAGMPAAVGTDFCVSEPRDRATVHAIRAAWLECDDWKDPANANCGGRGY